MYAVIVTGGKQYKVTEGDLLKIEKIDAAAESEITFDQVLLVADDSNINIGKPYVSGATVKATVVEQGRHAKIRIIKFRRRKHYMRRQGHRQWFTKVKINQIAV